MEIPHLHVGDDGQSCWGEIEIGAEIVNEGGIKFETLPAKGMSFRRSEPYEFDGWHNATNRQFLLVLDGVLEIMTGDRKIRRFEAGSILLADHLSGPGTKLDVPAPQVA